MREPSTDSCRHFSTPKAFCSTTRFGMKRAINFVNRRRADNCSKPNSAMRLRIEYHITPRPKSTLKLRHRQRRAASISSTKRCAQLTISYVGIEHTARRGYCNSTHSGIVFRLSRVKTLSIAYDESAAEQDQSGDRGSIGARFTLPGQAGAAEELPEWGPGGGEDRRRHIRYGRTVQERLEVSIAPQRVDGIESNCRECRGVSWRSTDAAARRRTGSAR